MSERTEWGVLERPSMGTTLEMTQRVVKVASEAIARRAVKGTPRFYTAVVKRTVTDWEEA